MSGLASPALEELINMPYVEAIERLGDRDVTVRLLAPPYAGVGVGTLHVVRCEDKGDSVELVLTYDDYERLAPELRSGTTSRSHEPELRSGTTGRSHEAELRSGTTSHVDEPEHRSGTTT